ncbi:MAG TPA: hypothetical protein VEG38_01660 [Acidimicrobiia bacterium]|nr:hypothetical protein [Acidimicrobiia bacterium]
MAKRSGVSQSAEDRRSYGTAQIVGWSDLADLLLQRAALVARLARDRMPDPLAGLCINDDDVDRLLGELPGLAGRSNPAADALDERLRPITEQAIESFTASLVHDTAFAFLSRNAALDDLEAAVLAVVCAIEMCAIEMDPRRQRLVAYLNDDVSQRRATPFLLDQLFGAERMAGAAVAPGRRLQAAALVSTTGGGTWAGTAIAVPAAVAWWLAGDRSRDPELPPGCWEVATLPAGDHDLITVAGPDVCGDCRRDTGAAVRRLSGQPGT